MTESVFLISLQVQLHSAADVMSLTRPLAVALQGEEQDLTQAVDLVAGVRQYLREKREKVDEKFKKACSDVQGTHHKATGGEMTTRVCR